MCSHRREFKYARSVSFYPYNRLQILMCVKDTMPVSYRSELFTSYILTSETYSRKYEKLPKIVLHAKILQKTCIC